MAENKTTEAPEYRIRTVIDFLKVPEDRRPICLREFGVWLSMGQSLQVIMEGMPLKWPTTFVWVDDDKHEASVSVQAGSEKIVIAKGPMKEFADAKAKP